MKNEIQKTIFCSKCGQSVLENDSIERFRYFPSCCTGDDKSSPFVTDFFCRCCFQEILDGFSDNFDDSEIPF